MKLSSIVVMLVLTSLSLSIHAQSYWFGPKFGPALSFQQWNGIDQNALFSINGDLAIETVSEDGGGTLMASLGYRTRGSGIRAFTFNQEFFGNQNFQFRNIVLEAGFKKYFTPLANKFIPWYQISGRAEYTVSTNLKQYERFQNAFYPNDDFVRPFTYGITFAGGFDYELNEGLRGFIELSLNPDLGLQYFQPPIQNVIDPWTRMTRTLPERSIRNVSVELKVGMKFLRKVEYID